MRRWLLLDPLLLLLLGLSHPQGLSDLLLPLLLSGQSLLLRLGLSHLPGLSDRLLLSNL